MNKKKLHHRYIQITQARFLEQVGFLIKVNAHTIALQAYRPQYDIFYIPKINGGRRLIENPNPVLKNIQRGLNKYLQCVYYCNCPESSFGFVINVKNGIKKDIITNAKSHIGHDFMMNIDMKDFFHDVSQNMVDNVFLGSLFNFNLHCARILSSICCYSGRLPMGAPTSPVLSNLACLPLDIQLSKLCKSLDICYTRYADDMSFSSSRKVFELRFYETINQIITQWGFSINPEKVKFSAKDRPKIVTGINIHKNGIGLSDSFFIETEEEIKKLKYIVSYYYKYNKAEDGVLRKHKQVILGYINYASRIYGEDNDEVQGLEDSYNEALSFTSWDMPMSWKQFPYIHF